MTDRATRKAELIARCARQRQALSQHMNGLHRVTKFVERGFALARFVKNRPILSTLLSTGLMAYLKKRRWLRKLTGTWFIFRAISALRSVCAKG